ncbi:MAG: DUF4184 family protein [Kofleriaceae bacterium]
MPFTPAHVVAVLPLLGARARRLPLDPTCLAIGAMAPDFEYFVRGRQVGELSHSWLGLAVFCVPMTLVLALVFHRVVKTPALRLMPAAVSARLVPALAAPWPAAPAWRAVPAAAASAALGATTHLVWDGFTHGRGVITQRVPALLAPVEVPGLGTMALCRVLQHASTVVGLGVLVGWLVRRRWPAPVAVPTAARARGYLVTVLAIAVGVALLTAYTIARGGRRGPSVGDHVVALIAGGLWGVVVAAVILRAPAQAWRDKI